MKTMSKILIALGLVTASIAPLAASAHTDVSVGLNLGGPAYYEPAPVYYAPPPPRVVYYGPSYYGPYYGPPVVRERVVYRGYYGPRYYQAPHYHHYDGRWH